MLIHRRIQVHILHGDALHRIVVPVDRLLHQRIPLIRERIGAGKNRVCLLKRHQNRPLIGQCSQTASGDGILRHLIAAARKTLTVFNEILQMENQRHTDPGVLADTGKRLLPDPRLHRDLLRRADLTSHHIRITILIPKLVVSAELAYDADAKIRSDVHSEFRQQRILTIRRIATVFRGRQNLVDQRLQSDRSHGV